MTALVTGLVSESMAEYLADARSALPSLSASIARVLVSQSPAHAYLAHPRLGGKQSASKSDEGTITHALLLNSGMERVKVIDAVYGPKHARAGEVVDDFRTNAAKEQRDAIEASGGTPVLAKDMQRIGGIADKFRVSLRDLGVSFDTTRNEQSVYWVEKADDGTPVQCRCRLDAWDAGAEVITDLKTCESAHPRAIQKHVESYGYHIQAEANRRAILATVPESRPRFQWAFAEMTAPHPVVVCSPAPSMDELGGLEWRQAVNAWAACQSSGVWPSYASGFQVQATAYRLQAALEAET